MLVVQSNLWAFVFASPGSPFQFISHKFQTHTYRASLAQLSSVSLVPDLKSGDDEVGCSIQLLGVCFLSRLFFVIAVQSFHQAQAGMHLVEPA